MSAPSPPMPAAGGDALLGMAALGKTAAVLALIIALILLCGYLLRRLGPHRSRPGLNLKVVASTALGPRERVVVVELEDTWLVLGVGGGQVSKLHELPAQRLPPGDIARPEAGFAGRFAQALKQQAGERLGGSRSAHRDGA
ncbi:flagellar biosynthetic protein FliO [Zobellella aerophila]|uniref:Flagellar protein n=1 Tax=Zobellella aerophila TaxID=870480 RepID=A0ABP6VSP4_9GAMM